MRAAFQHKGRIRHTVGKGVPGSHVTEGFLCLYWMIILVDPCDSYLRRKMMKSAKKILSGHYWRKAIIYFLTWCLVLSTSMPAVLAAPSGGVFTVGTGTIDYGTNTAVTVNQAQSVIQWGAPGSGGIDTSAAESLTFLQGAGLSNSAVLNRIMSGNPTQFNGALNGADMRIFVVNPAGIVFGSGSTVNVSQLIASGLNMSDADFLNATDSTPVDFRFEGGDGQVFNRGSITANSVYLVGKKVNNGGGIVARDGLIVLAAGDNVYLAQDGSNVVVEVAGVGDGTPDVDNRSLLIAENGRIVLAAGDTFSRAIRNVGWIVAYSGEVTAHAAQIENRGLIRTDANPAVGGDGGTVTLTGTESLLVGLDGSGLPGNIEADGSGNGNGGSITLETEGTLTVADGTLISARGGSSTGDGGSVKITAEHFAIAGQIDASPSNTDYNPGTLEIDPATVTIANGANAGATDTLYEQDIETWGDNGNNLVVYADDSILVEDILDGEIKGKLGNIELYTTGADSSISFADTTDTISTTQGDIKMGAGSGGLTIGSLETGGIEMEAIPGQIALSTHDGGDITAENLTIMGGQGHAEINVTASGNLTVNGDVMVGSELSPIYNVPNGQNAEAVAILKAGDNVVLDGMVGAYAEGIDDDVTTGDVTRAEITILSGTDYDENGDAFINGDLRAYAQPSSEGTAEAVIKVDAWGNITFGEGVDAYAVAGGADAGPGTVDDEANVDGDHAQIIIIGRDYPIPPPIGIADAISVSKSDVDITVDVLANDLQGSDPLVGGEIDSYTPPTAGTLTPVLEGESIVSLQYHPPEDLSTLTWDAEGHATVTFTYVAAVDGQLSGETTVTITLTNGLPVAVADAVSTTVNKAIQINVLANDLDPDADLLTAILVGAPAHGALVQNDDGTFTYTPVEGFIGPDSFTYSATDSLNSTAVQTVTINVNPYVVPSPPAIPVVAPGLERVEFAISGCPALIEWAAQELGMEGRVMQIWIANALVSARDIQPCDTCESLRRVATILQDADGVYTSALAKVVNEFISTTTPPTEEQMASIAEAMARNAGAENHYAIAGEYISALADYVSILTNEIGLPAQESVQFAADKYGARLATSGNAAVTAYVAARLAAMGG